MRTLKIILITILSLSMLPAYANKGKDKPAKVKKEKKEKEHKPAKPELTNTYWRLSEMNGKSIAPDAEGKDPYIYLIDQKRNHELSGFGGCNNITGEYKSGKDNAISFTAASTKMYCSNMAMDDYLNYAIANANRYMINGDHLLLYNDNMVLAIFEAKQ